MSTLESLLHGIVALLYLVAAITSLRFLFSSRPNVQRVSRLCVWSGWGLQTGLVLWRAFRHDSLPIHALSETHLLLLWLLVTVYLIGAQRWRIEMAGPLILSLVAVGYAGSFLWESGQAYPEEPSGGWSGLVLAVHVTTALIGHAFFILAFAIGVLYIFQIRQLKSHRPSGLFFRLPALEDLDRLNLRAVVVGLPLMTFSMVLGIYYAAGVRGMPASEWIWHPSVVSSALVWIFYAALLGARLSARVRGRKIAVLTILGFIIVIVSIAMACVFAPGLGAL
ncbi:MAG: cytochrome c biogenesis protein CcsA [Planctomycetota bacterium]